ncbi:helix-turn-helix domain-containing protein [Bacillus cereus group sp. BfR-BA-01380]|uniref:helix-turn-helix domain-containing protein n=1 Tax=Bacillus cereus group sp. BfR-BA-01380 TaxID=2920324 RepID=UPI001F5ABBFD|nr:helix-turn-helix domain-containing protein [Bacillus cereus group sp. BfR-BA-01380]
MERIKYSKAKKLAILALYKDGHQSIADITSKFRLILGRLESGREGMKRMVKKHYKIKRNFNQWGFSSSPTDY